MIMIKTALIVKEYISQQGQSLILKVMINMAMIKKVMIEKVLIEKEYTK